MYMSLCLLVIPWRICPNSSLYTHQTFGIKDLEVFPFANANTSMTDCKLVSTPLEHGSHLYNDDNGAFPDVPQYCHLIGRPLYLTITRPDIHFAIWQLSQFLSTSIKAHLQAAQRVLKY